MEEQRSKKRAREGEESPHSESSTGESFSSKRHKPNQGGDGSTATFNDDAFGSSSSSSVSSASSGRHLREQKQVRGADTSLFEQFIAEGYTWLRVWKFADKAALAKGVSADEIVAGLVRYRDVLDYEMYELAVRQVFPREYFAVRTTSRVELDQQDEPAFKFYTFKIYDHSDAGFNVNPMDHYCQIEVRAPGSRTLTSDIDTTLSVQGVAHLTLTKCDLLREALKEHEPQLLVQAMVIEQFHQLQERTSKCGGMTSAMSRDSNVYSDGFLRKKEIKENQPAAYPKFKVNPTVLDQLFLQQPDAFYAPFKQRKHHLEFAASLVSLQASLKERDPGWEAFKKMLTDKDQMEEFGIEGLDTALVEQDLSAIFALTEKLYDYQQTQIRAQLKEPRASKLQGKEAEKDQHIAALNSLYTYHLKRLSGIAYQLSNLMSNMDARVQEVEKTQKDRQNILDEIAHLATPFSQGKPFAIKSHAKLLQKKAHAEENYKKAREALNNLLEKQATLQNQYQEAQIQANLFAFEAYINRSAPYHVVEGMQGGQSVPFSKQVVVGSALQQIGFKLLHLRELVEDGYFFEAAAYKTAKYGQRVAHLIFGQSKQPYEPSQLRRIQRGKARSSHQILTTLKPKEDFHRSFTDEEYTLLNSELLIVGQVKNNKAVPEGQKADKTREILQAHLPRVVAAQSALSSSSVSAFPSSGPLSEAIRLWLPIAAKVFMAGYKARLDKKPGLLWGTPSMSAGRVVTGSSVLEDKHVVSSSLSASTTPVLVAPAGVHISSSSSSSSSSNDNPSNFPRAFLPLLPPASFFSQLRPGTSGNFYSQAGRDMSAHGSIAANYGSTAGGSMTANAAGSSSQRREESEGSSSSAEGHSSPP